MVCSARMRILISLQFLLLWAATAVDATAKDIELLGGNRTDSESELRGVDYSTLVSVDAHMCLVESGYTFAVPRGFRSSGVLDENVCQNLINAQAAGVSIRDVYIFPCPTCSASAAEQMSTLVSHLQDNCEEAWSGRVWLDIEGSEYWTGSYTNNEAFFESLVDSCASTGVRCGVYSSQYQWQSIFGSTSYCYGDNSDGSFPVWYSHYDNDPAFDDYYSKYSFGCWTDLTLNPLAKQFSGTTSVCGASVDLNSALM